MGKLRSRLVKRTARKALEKNRDKFGTDFDSNKVTLASLLNLPSKRMRNLIAGYLTRLFKQG